MQIVRNYSKNLHLPTLVSLSVILYFCLNPMCIPPPHIHKA